MRFEGAAAVKRLWIPADRFVAIVEHAKPHPDSSMARKLFDLRHGRQDFISLEAADRILTDLDLHHLFHVSREDGGLADIYVDGIQYGSPDHNRRYPQGGSKFNRRYATEAERQEARRRTYREAYERRKLRRAA